MACILKMHIGFLAMFRNFVLRIISMEVHFPKVEILQFLYKLISFFNFWKLIASQSERYGRISCLLVLEQKTPYTIQENLPDCFFMHHKIRGILGEQRMCPGATIHSNIHPLIGQIIISILLNDFQCLFRHTIAFFQENQRIQGHNKLFTNFFIMTVIFVCP